MFVDTAGEEVLHQAGLDTLLLGNQGLSLFNRPVHRREDLGDFGLFRPAGRRYRISIFSSNVLMVKPWDRFGSFM